MSVRYVTTELGNPQNVMAPKKFYLTEKSIGSIDRNYLIKDMVRNSSLTPMEAATGIDYLFEAIPRFLELGFTVQLGELGYFKVFIQSEGSDVVDEATPDKIRGIRMRFMPGEGIRERVKDFSVKRFPR